MPFYCPHPDCCQKCKSNRDVTYHLNHNPKCKTVTPYYHLKFQTGLSNKFQTPTAKKQRTLDTNSPFHSPPKFTNETYLEEEGCITASPYNEQVPCSESPTLLDTAEPIDIFPTDEENELEVYLSKLSLDVEPMDNFKLGNRSRSKPNPQSPQALASHSLATDSPELIFITPTSITP